MTSYNLSSNEFGYNVSAAYTHILEKPDVQHIQTFEDVDAPKKAVKQRTTHDCLIGACEYMGPDTYAAVLKKFGANYTPGKGSNTQQGLESVYGAGKVSGYAELNPVMANKTWKAGGNVLIAQNSNHAIVLNKIEQYKVTYKYRKTKIQTKFKFTYMNPATGKFVTTGMKKHYKSPTFHITR